ncbi:hypothetical protein KIPB_002517 [Kipferlia bialata]|uniref:Kelch repeat type 1 n=1 Tax=Kipferlia bialata TaxID=797122 RepID=A0A9K3CRI7_9EUKA|nr:hypothetical protein KIPB_002517 [Kipferlia bialata]|eukprot:g2517.t1
MFQALRRSATIVQANTGVKMHCTEVDVQLHRPPANAIGCGICQIAPNTAFIVGQNGYQSRTHHCVIVTMEPRADEEEVEVVTEEGLYEETHGYGVMQERVYGAEMSAVPHSCPAFPANCAESYPPPDQWAQSFSFHVPPPTEDSQFGNTTPPPPTRSRRPPPQSMPSGFNRGYGMGYGSYPQGQGYSMSPPEIDGDCAGVDECIPFTIDPACPNDVYVLREEVLDCPLDKSVRDCTAVCVGSDVIVYGGIHANTQTFNTEMWRYSVPAKTWHIVRRHRGHAWPDPRCGHGAFEMGGCMYIIGGRNKDMLSDMWMFSPRDQRWTRGPDLPIPGVGTSCVCVGEEVHAVGGGFPNKTHLKFTREAGWQTLPDLPFFVIKPYCYVYGTQVVVVGGEFHENSCTAFDTATGVWTDFGQSPINLAATQGCPLSPSTAMVHTSRGTIIACVSATGPPSHGHTFHRRWG